MKNTKPDCSNHIVPEYLQDLKKVAIDIANMPYDKVEEFFKHYKEKMEIDSDNDFDGERFRVSFLLSQAEIHSDKLESIFNELWKICKPYMK